MCIKQLAPVLLWVHTANKHAMVAATLGIGYVLCAAATTEQKQEPQKFKGQAHALLATGSLPQTMHFEHQN